jgi:hypothetical protein
MDVIFLPCELLRGNHQLVEVIHDGECGADLDPKGKTVVFGSPYSSSPSSRTRLNTPQEP